MHNHVVTCGEVRFPFRPRDQRVLAHDSGVKLSPRIVEFVARMLIVVAQCNLKIARQLALWEDSEFKEANIYSTGQTPFA